MYRITREQFLLRQPSFPQTEPTDEYYFQLTNRLITEIIESGILAAYPDPVIGRAALCVIGYFQDIMVDAGVWRSFINECRRLYGCTLPFYEVGDSYVDYELNGEDVRFLLWYALSMNFEEKRVADPLSPVFEKAAELWTRILSEVYEEAPHPEGFKLARELDMDDTDDSNAIVDLGHWLFLHCYLMTPAYAMTLAEILAEPDMQGSDNMPLLQRRLEESMSEDPTGPLALYLREWLYLVVDNKTLAPTATREFDGEPHKYFTAFTKATGGDILKFFGDYDSLNRFFIEALGWAEGEEHLPQMKGCNDFILMVNKEKGMLMAHDIARCIAAPGNTLYDPAYAKKHAIELLTVRGCCPADLLHYVCEHHWLPDAVFPGSDDHALVASNYDFIARCFLQKYYRGD